METLKDASERLKELADANREVAAGMKSHAAAIDRTAIVAEKCRESFELCGFIALILWGLTIVLKMRRA